MIKTITTAVFGLFICFTSIANDYEDAWMAISQKKFKEAKSLLQKAIKDPNTTFDAYLTLLFLKTYEGDESNIDGLVDKLTEMPNRNAYLYSLWFNGAVLGDYGKKKSYQLNLLNKALNRQRIM